MLKSKKTRDAARRFAALTLAFLMVFQYTVSGLNVWAWAEDGSEKETSEVTQVEEQKEEVKEDQDKPAPEEPAKESEEPEKKEEEKPQAKDEGKADEKTEEPEKKDTEYPAQSFEEKASGVTVRISAPEGALPEGTTVTVEPVKLSSIIDAIEEAAGEDAKVVKAVDITFRDKDGKEIEPEKQVSVNMTNSEFGKLNEPKVFHIDDDGVAEQVDDKKVGTYKNQIAVNTKDFSVYAIVETGEDARVLVRFVKPDGTEIDSMYIKKNDDMNVVLYDPGAGELADGVYFRGWTTDPEYTTNTSAQTIADIRTSFGSSYDWDSVIDADSTGGTVVTYYAMLFKDYRITYYDEKDISLGQEEVTFRADASSDEQPYTVNMAYTVQDDTHHFEGWNVLEGGTNIVGHTDGDTYENKDNITITGDVSFGVNAPAGHWFIFDENGKGATYNAPQFIQSGQTPTRPNDNSMIRNGYTFGGWFADKATADQTSGGTQYNFNQQLTDKVTVYARWIPNTTAPYTIIVWKQNLAADGYDFVTSISRTGNVNSTINDVTKVGDGNNAYARINGTNYQYTGFHLKEYDEGVTIRTEGNSVVNVYYDRTEYTLTFRQPGSGTTTYSYVYNGNTYNLTIGQNDNGNANTYESNKKTISGFEVSYRRRTNGTYRYAIKINGTWFRVGDGNEGAQVYNATSITANTSGVYKTITALYGQSIGDNFPITENGANAEWRWAPQGSTTFNQVLVYIDIMPAENVTFNPSTSTASNKYMEFYVEALPGQTPTRTFNGKGFVKYGNTITAKYNYFTEAEDFIDLTGYAHYGSEPAFVNGRANVTDGGTLRLYYTRNVYDINFMDGKYVNGDGNPMEEAGMGQIGTETGIAYGADVSSHNSYVPENTPKGYVFEGWYLDDACTQPYTFSTMPEGGVTVYAKWRQKQYRVFLHVNYPEGATGNINWGTQNQAMNFRISEGGHVSEPTGRDLAGFEFVGWYLDEECTEVFNGEAYTINEDNVTTPYDKTVDMTDTYNNNGFLIDPQYNSDATGYKPTPDSEGQDRFWITKKLDIYAKWRSTLDGASGIVVEYDANGGTNAPSDSNTYVDGADAPAGAASRPAAGSNKVFGYWDVQKWENGEWTSSGTTVLPGDTFKVLARNAKVEDVTNPPAGSDTKKYTVRLKAVYIDTEEPTRTHIYWYKNTGEDAYIKSNNIEINTAVNIPAAPTRAGYKFLGWARVNIGNTREAAAAWEQTGANWTQDLTASNLYLYYKDADETYHLNSTSGRTVTQVAPDENTPYHAMFAVWQPELTVKITGNTDTKVYNGGEQSVTGFTVEYYLGGVKQTSTPEGVSVALKTGKTAEAKGTDVKTDPGYMMGLTLADFDIDPGSYYYDPANEDNEYTDGWLEITPASVTLTADSDSKVYNGASQTISGFTPSVAGLTFEGVSASGSGTNVGTYDVTFTGVTVNTTTDTTGNYVVTGVTNGTLTITAAPVTVKAKNDGKVYDNDPTNPGSYEATVTGTFNGDTIEYTVSREAGEDVGEYTITPSGDAVQGNYTVTYETGTFTITPVTEKVIVTIKEAEGSYKYDGEEKSITGYTVASISNELYTAGDFNYTGGDAKLTVKGTDAGSYPMTLTANDFVNTSANFSNVEFVIVDGTLEIGKRTVTLTSATDSKTYNGTPLTNHNVTVGGDGFVGEEGATYSVTGTITDVGSTSNAFTYTLKDGTKAGNYNITTVPGTLTINPVTEKVTVTITEHSGSYKYDGTQKSASGYDVSIDNPLYTQDCFTFSGNATVTGKNAGTYDMELAASDFTNTSSNFTNVEFIIVDGQLKISKREVTLTSATDTRVYNGQPLTNDTVTVSGDGFVDGEGATYNVTGSQTAVGSSDNTFTYTLKDGTAAGNYDITKVEGTLTVTALTDKVTVTITENSGTEKYDGTEKEVTGYTVSISNPLYTENDFTFSGNKTVKGTDAGTYNMELKASDFTNINTNFSNVEFVIVDGTLTITKRAVTLTSATDSKVYDRTPLTNDEVTVSGDGFAAGEGATYNVTGTRTEVGTSPNAFTYTLKDGTKAGNYEISTVEGNLTVTAVTSKVTVTITEHSGSEEYNGAVHTVTGYDVDISNDLYKLSDFSFIGPETDQTASGKDAGSYDLLLDPEDFQNNNTNFTDVEFVIVDGQLTITKKLVIISADAKEKFYGEQDPELTAKVEGLVSGDPMVVYTLSRAIGENVGEYAIHVNTSTPQQGNYDVSFEDSIFKIKPVQTEVTVTIKENSGEFKYDGSPKTISGYTVESISDPLYTEEDFAYVGDSNKLTVTETDAGTYDMELAPSDFTNNSQNFTNVKFVIVDGTLKINKRTVTLTSATDEKVYDGQPLTNNNVTVGGDGFAENEGATYNVTGTITDVGETENTFTYTLNNGTKAANYDISKAEGTLKVTALTEKVTVTITENSGTEKYDGSEKTVTGYTVSISNTLYKTSDFEFSGNDTVKGTDAGTYQMQLKPADFTNKSENFTNVEFVIVDGTLKINKRTVTLTSATDQKTYNGKPLTNHNVTVGGDGFVSGEGAEYSVTGTITDVGSTSNTFTYTLEEGTKAGNYDISTAEGTLTINPVTSKVTVTITEHSGSFKYDGTEKSASGYDVSIDNELYTEECFTFSGNATVTKTDAGTYDMELKASDFANISSNFTNVEFVIVDGQLKISKRKVTLTSATDTKVYNGQPLTNDTVTVSGDGFVTGEGATYSVTGSQTPVGSSANTFTYTLNEGTKAANYDITKVEGTLTVTAHTDKVTVTITEKSGTEKYDGTEKEVTGYTVSISNPLYKTSDFTFSGNDTVKGTDAGTYQMQLKAADFTNTSENFTNVEFVIVDGTLTINKRAVTLTSATDQKTYDGQPLTNKTVTVSGDGFAEGEGAAYNVTGTRTDAGTSQNTFEYTLNSNTKAGNYEISVVEGTLTVNPVSGKVTVTITENSGTEKYDGSEKEVTGYKVSTNNTLYTEACFTFSGNASVKGTDAGTYNMDLKASDFTNLSENFTDVEFVIVDGTLKIEKRKVTLTSATDEKVYNGQPLTNDNVAVSGDGFADGEGASYNVTGTITNVGSTPNAFTYTLNEGTKEGNYEITTVPGTLTITPVTAKITVTITENSGTEKYDGSEKTVTGYTVSTSNTLYTEADFTFSGNDSVSGTDAGTYDMDLKASDFANISENFTDVEFVIVDGTLTINKRAVTLTSASDEKEYDGQPLMNSNVAVTGDGFAEGEGATYDVTGRQVEEGSSPNTFTYDLNSNTKADNYDITLVPGTLTVTAVTDKVTVTITENSGTEKYDGTEKEVKGYTVSIDNDLYTENDFTFSGNDTVSGTDAGTYEMQLKPEDFTNTSDNFSNVEFVIVDGTLTINKRTVTLTSADDDKTYDGTPLTNSNVAVSGDGFATGEGATYNVTGTITNVGQTPNAFTYTLNEGTKEGNYEITTVPGTLTIAPVTSSVIVTITENSGTEKYDGTEKTVDGYKVSIDNPLYTENDFSFSGDDTVSGTDAGTYDMDLKASDFTNTSTNFTNVTFVIVNGQLTINKRTVTLTSATDEKVYDGDPLTNSNVAVSGDGFADGEGATYSVTGTITNVGETSNAFTYTLNEGTNADNYTITTVPGTLTITPVTDKVTVKITEHSDTAKYDGEEHTVTGYDVTSISNELYTADCFTFNGNDSVSGKNAGSYDMDLKASDFTNTSSNFTNVEFVIVDGTLEISKRSVTLTSADDEKVYDGQPLTNNNVAVSGDGFAEGEGATYNVTGTQTKKGSSDNTFTYELNKGTSADNYDIDVVYGTLTVTAVTDKVTVTITENSGTAKYDGEEHTVTGYEVTSISNPLYTEADFTFSGTDSVSGTDAGSYDMELVATDFTNISEDFGNVEFVIVDGTLEISKRSVTLTSADDEKVYDKTPLTNDEVTVGGDGFVEGEGATYDVTGTRTEVGETPNAFTYTLKEGTKADNYDIETVYGTLTVTAVTDKITVTITEHSDTATYDGEEHVVTGYDFASSDPLYTEDDITFTGYATITGKDAGSYPMELEATDFANANSNFENVEFEIVDGTLEIEKRAVTVTADDLTKVYDNDPTKPAPEQYTATVDGLVAGESIIYTVKRDPEDISENVGEHTILATGEGIQDNYTVTYYPGTLTITPVTDKVTVTITENSGSEMYDGEEHTVTGYEVSIDNELYTEDDFTFSGTDSVSGTDAGSYPMELAATDFTNISDNFTNVEFVIVDGTLEISKRSVTLTSADDDKVYDGTPLTNSTVTVTGDGFVSGEGATYDVTGTITDFGEVPNAFTYTLNEGTKADNYDITKVEGTLKITPVTDKVTVTITENSGSEKYDGTRKTVEGYTVSIDNRLYTENDFSFSGNATIEGTDAGTYNMELKAADFTNTSDNFTNVEFVIVDGTLEIGKRSVTLTSADDEKVYDGTPLTNKTVTVSGDGFAAGEGATYNVTGTITDKGETDNTFTYTLNDGTKADNYDIEVVEGTLKITPVTEKVTVTITGHTGTAVYDSEEHTVSGYDVYIDNDLYTAACFTFSGTDSVTEADAGTYPMGLKNSDFANISENFTNVVFEVEDGSLEISKRAVTVTITGHEGSAVYDGDEHSVSGYDAKTEDKLYDTGDITYSGNAEAKGRDAGTYEMGLTKDQFGNRNDNFEITFVVTDGSLTIDPYNINNDPDNRITVTDPDDTVYNGKDQEQPVTITDSKTGGELKEGKDFVIEYSDDVRNVGEVTVTIKGIGNYEDEVFKQYNITPAAVKIIADDKEVVYGDKLPKLTATVTGIIGNEEVKYDLEIEDPDEKLSNAGEYTIGVILTDEPSNGIRLNEVKNIGNYTVTTENGTLTIDEAPLTISTGSDTKRYDGTALTKKPATVKGLRNGDKIKVTVTGSQTQVGSSKNTFKIDWQDTDKHNYDLTKNVGTLTVTAANNPAPVNPTPVNPTPAPQPTPDPEPVEDTEVPLPEPADTVPEEEAPLQLGSWALINLICTILTVLLSLLVLVMYLGKNKKKADEDEDEAQTEDAEKDQKIRKKGILRIMDIIPAVAAVITFILTEDMSLPMVLTDKWTLLMAVILLVDVVVALFTKKSTKDAEENEDEAEAQE